MRNPSKYRLSPEDIDALKSWDNLLGGDKSFAGYVVNPDGSIYGFDLESNSQYDTGRTFNMQSSRTGAGKNQAVSGNIVLHMN